MLQDGKRKAVNEMSENNVIYNEDGQPEYITEKEARTIKDMFIRNIQSYKEKDASVSDEEWLENLFKNEIPDYSEEDAKKDANDTVKTINLFGKKLKSVNEAYENGVSKEQWLEKELNDSVSGLSQAEAAEYLQSVDKGLKSANLSMEEALRRNSDGHVNMNPNLDGNIAEHVVANSASMDAMLKGKNIKVDVLQSNGKNSVDVRATNLDSGKYQNYQLKFGKTAKDTINYIEDGNYNNQRIIVPSEQLEEVQTHFKNKGSLKTITDRIEIDGVEGQAFTKNDVKNMQLEAQATDTTPQLDYSNMSNKALMQSIGKAAGRNALLSAAISTGINLASKIFKGEEVKGDELVADAIKTGADTSVKVAAAGTLQVAVRRGVLKCLAKTTPVGALTSIACAAVENVKILYRIATKKVSPTEGLHQMGRVTAATFVGMSGMVKGAAIGAKAGTYLMGIIPAAPAVTGFLGGAIGYIAGSKIGEKICDAGRAVVNTAKNIVSKAVNGVKSLVSKITNSNKNTVTSKN